MEIGRFVASTGHSDSADERNDRRDESDAEESLANHLPGKSEVEKKTRETESEKAIMSSKQDGPGLSYSGRICLGWSRREGKKERKQKKKKKTIKSTCRHNEGIQKKAKTNKEEGRNEGRRRKEEEEKLTETLRYPV